MPWTTPPASGATVHIWNGYSLAERDRRWQAVRESAAKAGLDCIFVPLGNGVEGRYLTQLRCSAMVLPTDGRAPIVIADRRSSNAWVPEPWQTGREWAEPMGEALLDDRVRTETHLFDDPVTRATMPLCSRDARPEVHLRPHVIHRARGAEGGLWREGGSGFAGGEE